MPFRVERENVNGIIPNENGVGRDLQQPATPVRVAVPLFGGDA